jgi:hypothetical protein
MKVNVIALCLVDTALHCGTGRAFMNNSSGVGIERYKVKCLKRALDGELLGIYRRRTEKKQNQRKSRLHFALVVHGSCVFESSCRVRQEARTVRGDRICRAGLLPTKPLIEASSAQTG